MSRRNGKRSRRLFLLYNQGCSRRLARSTPARCWALADAWRCRCRPTLLSCRLLTQAPPCPTRRTLTTATGQVPAARQRWRKSAWTRPSAVQLPLRWPPHSTRCALAPPACGPWRRQVTVAGGAPLPRVAPANLLVLLTGCPALTANLQFGQMAPEDGYAVRWVPDSGFVSPCDGGRSLVPCRTATHACTCPRLFFATLPPANPSDGSLSLAERPAVRTTLKLTGILAFMGACNRQTTASYLASLKASLPSEAAPTACASLLFRWARPPAADAADPSHLSQATW